MSSRRHLKLLKQGVHAWNKWKSENPRLRPELSGADLSSSDLSNADLSRAVLLDADLSDAVLSDAVLSEADLRRAVLNDAFLFNATLSNADLSGARLNGARLDGANLRGADLRGADLSGAGLFFVNLSDARLEDADFTNVSLGASTFGDNDLSRVKGLETVFYAFPSTIGIDTIYKSQGHIPEVFLRGCGVQEDFITYMRSLVVQPIQFYTCFISFTEADDQFSERLYNDLHATGVRCWRWKEDAKWGRSLMHSIDEAVRVYDKLIVICSEPSLNSPAVSREIERALQKEDELARAGQEGEVLFPLRLDDYIFEGWNHHRKADVLAKHVGDFRGWKNYDSYRKAFDRLLRDLTAGAERR